MNVQPRFKQRWVFSAEQDAAIVRAYELRRKFANGKAITALPQQIGVPKYMVSQRACKLGISRTKEKPWSQTELELIEANGQLGNRALQGLLKKQGFDRTQNAIKIKSVRAGLASRDGFFSATAVSNGLGCDIHYITRAIRDGKLLASRKGTNRNERQGGDAWLIRHDHLQRYFFNCAAEIELARVGKWWFLGILTDGKVVQP